MKLRQTHSDTLAQAVTVGSHSLYRLIDRDQLLAASAMSVSPLLVSVATSEFYCGPVSLSGVKSRSINIGSTWAEDNRDSIMRLFMRHSRCVCNARKHAAICWLGGPHEREFTRGYVQTDSI